MADLMMSNEPSPFFPRQNLTNDSVVSVACMTFFMVGQPQQTLVFDDEIDPRFTCRSPAMPCCVAGSTSQRHESYLWSFPAQAFYVGERH